MHAHTLGALTRFDWQGKHLVLTHTEPNRPQARREFAPLISIRLEPLTRSMALAQRSRSHATTMWPTRKISTLQSFAIRESRRARLAQQISAEALETRTVQRRRNSSPVPTRESPINEDIGKLQSQGPRTGCIDSRFREHPNGSHLSSG